MPNLQQIWNQIKRANAQSFLLGIFVFIALFGVIIGITESQIANENSLQQVVYTNANGIKHELTVEVADTPSKRAFGLMNRTYLPQNQGMLFIFEIEQPLQFWMQNTFIPLDIIFLDKNYQVVKIHENTIPDQTDERYSSEEPAKFVLETNAGWVKRTGLQEGDFINIR